MAKIIGISNPMSFEAKDGAHIEGLNVFLANPLDPKKGTGEEGEKIFLSTAKLAKLPFKPMVGQETEVLYNRYGKVHTLRLLEGDIPFDV